LAGVSFCAGAGEIVGLLGPNGAGKTTLMRILAGYLSPTGGSAAMAGLDVARDSLAVRALLGYLPENAALHHEMRVVEYLRYRAALKGVARPQRSARIEQAMLACGIESVRARIIGQLSKGYRQRVSLAATLLHDPRLLILDEPTVGLDPNQQAEIRGLVRRLGEKRTVLFSTHILSEAEAVCGRVVIIDRGRLVANGPPAELAQRLRFQQLRIAARGDAERLLAVLETIPDLKVEVVTRAPLVQLVLNTGGITTIEQRAAISRALVAAGAVIIEMAPVETRLEEIFHRLTAAEAA
jgi:ABC-2 type transport system ATP-binding protein